MSDELREALGLLDTLAVLKSSVDALRSEITKTVSLVDGGFQAVAGLGNLLKSFSGLGQHEAAKQVTRTQTKIQEYISGVMKLKFERILSGLPDKNNPVWADFRSRADHLGRLRQTYKKHLVYLNQALRMSNMKEAVHLTRTMKDVLDTWHELQTEAYSLGRQFSLFHADKSISAFRCLETLHELQEALQDPFRPATRLAGEAPSLGLLASSDIPAPELDDSLHELRPDEYLSELSLGLTNPVVLAFFHRFLSLNHAEESLDFFLAVRQFAVISPSRRPAEAKRIYDHYVADGSPHEIEIDTAVALDIQVQLEHGGAEVFDEAMEQVHEILKEAYQRFQSHALFDELSSRWVEAFFPAPSGGGDSRKLWLRKSSRGKRKENKEKSEQRKPAPRPWTEYADSLSSGSQQEMRYATGSPTGIPQTARAPSPPLEKKRSETLPPGRTSPQVSRRVANTVVSTDPDHYTKLTPKPPASKKPSPPPTLSRAARRLDFEDEDDKVAITDKNSVSTPGYVAESNLELQKLLDADMLRRSGVIIYSSYDRTVGKLVSSWREVKFGAWVTEGGISIERTSINRAVVSGEFGTYNLRVPPPTLPTPVGQSVERNGRSTVEEMKLYEETKVLRRRQSTHKLGVENKEIAEQPAAVQAPIPARARVTGGVPHVDSPRPSATGSPAPDAFEDELFRPSEALFSTVSSQGNSSKVFIPRMNTEQVERSQERAQNRLVGGLRDPTLAYNFLDFLLGRHCVETLALWLELNKFKQLSDAVELVNRFDAIMYKFLLDSESEFQCNLSHENLMAVSATIQVTSSTFDALQQEVQELLDNEWTIFSQSQGFKDGFTLIQAPRKPTTQTNTTSVLSALTEHLRSEGAFPVDRAPSPTLLRTRSPRSLSPPLSIHNQPVQPDALEQKRKKRGLGRLTQVRSEKRERSKTNPTPPKMGFNALPAPALPALAPELSELLRLPENWFCADCGTEIEGSENAWASVNLGIFLCVRCSGVHRGLGVEVSQVRSVRLDTLSTQQIARLASVGNKRAKEIWDDPELPPPDLRTQEALVAWITRKYKLQGLDPDLDYLLDAERLARAPLELAERTNREIRRPVDSLDGLPLHVSFITPRGLTLTRVDTRVCKVAGEFGFRRFPITTRCQRCPNASDVRPCAHCGRAVCRACVQRVKSEFLGWPQPRLVCKVDCLPAIKQRLLTLSAGDSTVLLNAILPSVDGLSSFTDPPSPKTPRRAPSQQSLAAAATDASPSPSPLPVAPASLQPPAGAASSSGSSSADMGIRELAYFHNVTALEAEELLTGEPPGTFLFRPSSNPGSYAISLVVQDHSIQKVLISPGPRGIDLILFGEELRFKSVADLREKTAQLLTQPLNHTDWIADSEPEPEPAEPDNPAYTPATLHELELEMAAQIAALSTPSHDSPTASLSSSEHRIDPIEPIAELPIPQFVLEDFIDIPPLPGPGLCSACKRVAPTVVCLECDEVYCLPCDLTQHPASQPQHHRNQIPQEQGLIMVQNPTWDVSVYYRLRRIFESVIALVTRATSIYLQWEVRPVTDKFATVGLDPKRLMLEQMVEQGIITSDEMKTRLSQL